jgi:hypothetical protein
MTSTLLPPRHAANLGHQIDAHTPRLGQCRHQDITICQSQQELICPIRQQREEEAPAEESLTLLNLGFIQFNKVVSGSFIETPIHQPHHASLQATRLPHPLNQTGLLLQIDTSHKHSRCQSPLRRRTNPYPLARPSQRPQCHIQTAIMGAEVACGGYSRGIRQQWRRYTSAEDFWRGCRGGHEIADESFGAV